MGIACLVEREKVREENRYGSPKAHFYIEQILFLAVTGHGPGQAKVEKLKSSFYLLPKPTKRSGCNAPVWFFFYNGS